MFGVQCAWCVIALVCVCVANVKLACVCFACSTRAFIFPRKPNMTPAEALAILAKLEAVSKIESEESYV